MGISRWFINIGFVTVFTDFRSLGVIIIIVMFHFPVLEHTVMYCQYIIIIIITTLNDLLKSLNWTTCQFKQLIKRYGAWKAVQKNTRKFCGLFSKLHHVARCKIIIIIINCTKKSNGLCNECNAPLHLTRIPDLFSRYNCFIFLLYCTVFKLVWPWTSLLLFCFFFFFFWSCSKKAEAVCKKRE